MPVNAESEALDVVVPNDDPISGKWSTTAPIAPPSAPTEPTLSIADPVRDLTTLFLAGLRSMATDRPIGLFFDGHERTRCFLDRWLQDVLEGCHGELPSSTVVVVAGMTAFDDDGWRGFEPLTASIALAPFSDEETGRFLAHHRVRDERVIRAIQQLPCRLPLMVATLALTESVRRDLPTEYGQTATDWLLATLDEPTRRAAALDLALPRSFDVETLVVVLDGPPPAGFLDWMRTMPFVEKGPAAWAYHHAARDVLLRLDRERMPARWKHLHGRLAAYYERLADSVDSEAPSVVRDETRTGYQIEAAYHRLCERPGDHLATALGRFVETFDLDHGLAARLAATIRQAGVDGDDPETRKWGERLVAGTRDLMKRRAALAASLFDDLVAMSDLDADLLPIALHWSGRLWFSDSRFDLALDRFSRLVQLCPALPSPWVERGVALTRLERYREAIESFERALDVDPSHADALAFRDEARVRRDATRPGMTVLGGNGGGIDTFPREGESRARAGVSTLSIAVTSPRDGGTNLDQRDDLLAVESYGA